MGDKSKIEWTDATWNPTVGCSVVSPGCTHCYAMKMAARLEAMAMAARPRWTPAHRNGQMLAHYMGTTKRVNGNAVWTGKLALAPDHILTAPLRWKRPRRIFVNSMSDLFHENVPDEWIDKVFATMALAPQHTFQVLTKRAERMHQYLRNEYWALEGRIFPHWVRFGAERFGTAFMAPQTLQLPLPNVWLGVSAEDQKRADERIPHLLQTPAAVRFVSAEPLLGPMVIAPYLHDSDCRMITTTYDPCTCSEPREVHLDWVIVGGESGPNARPMHPHWARSLRGQCYEAGVPFFFKQWGQWHADALLFTDTQGRNPPPNMKIGKHAAGRLLDSREHNEIPERA